MAIIYKSNEELEKNRKVVKEYIVKNKHDKYIVMDIGGAANLWCDELVDVYVDCKNIPNKNVIVGNILNNNTWDKIRDVNPSFILCTHVLEDLRDPAFILENINAIGCPCYIAMPNKYMELSPVESMLFVGYSHHRWIFSLHDDVLKIMMKSSMTNIFSFYGGIGYVMQMLPLFGKKFATIKKSFNYLQKPYLPWWNSGLACHKNELGILFENGIEYVFIDDDVMLSSDRMYEIYTKELANGL